MIKFFLILIFLGGCIVILLFGTKGCGSFFPEPALAETEDENFIQGQALAMGRRDREAMEAFYKVINSRRDAAESHLELGLIAMRQEMPLDAIFHFRQYLRQRPDSAQNREVNDQIQTAMFKFLQTLPGRPFETSTSDFTQNLEKKYKAVASENELLKRRLAESEQRLAQLERTRVLVAQPPVAGTQVVAGTGTVVARQVPQAAVNRPAIPRVHVVSKGDTLTSISKKYYGTIGKWQKIYENNRDIMSSPSELDLGMILKLPPQ